MQLSSISRRIALGTLRTIRKQFPYEIGDQPSAAFEPPAGGEALEIEARRVGFVQYYAFNGGTLAPPREVRFLDLLVDTGSFIVEGQIIARAWIDGDASRELHEKLRALVVIGDERDVDQDAAFGLRQLVDIALRGLSPGVNDPTTAVACLHYLQMLIAELARRQLGVQVRGDDSRSIRLPGMSFEGYVDLAFEEIALFGAAQPRVLRELDSALQHIEAVVHGKGASGRASHLRTLRSRLLGG
jgi:uncharacterized membrane protein